MITFDFLEWIMVLFPVLDIYLTPIPGISIGELLLLGLGGILVIRKKTICIENNIIHFYIYILLVTAILTLPKMGEVELSGIYSLLSYFLYAIFVLIYMNIGNVESFCKKYVKVVRVICVISLIQFILLQIGVRIPLLIPGIVNDIGLTYAQIRMILNSMCGPFTEPAHLAQYISIGLIIILLQKGMDLKNAVLFTVTMALTLKGSAVVLLMTIYGVKLCKYLYLRNTRLLLRAVFILLCGMAGIFILYQSVDSVRIMFSRIYEITGNGDRSLTGYHGVSGYFRVKYGFDVYKSLNFFNKIFGIGVGSFSLYDGLSVIPKRILQLSETYALENWRSGITTIMIDGGAIGLVLYVTGIFKNKTYSQKYFAIVLIALQCVEGAINTPMWLMYLFLVFKYVECDISIEKEVKVL